MDTEKLIRLGHEIQTSGVIPTTAKWLLVEDYLHWRWSSGSGNIANSPSSDVSIFEVLKKLKPLGLLTDFVARNNICYGDFQVSSSTQFFQTQPKKLIYSLLAHLQGGVVR